MRRTSNTDYLRVGCRLCWCAVVHSCAAQSSPQTPDLTQNVTYSAEGQSQPAVATSTARMAQMGETSQLMTSDPFVLVTASLIATHTVEEPVSPTTAMAALVAGVTLLDSTT